MNYTFGYNKHLSRSLRGRKRALFGAHAGLAVGLATVLLLAVFVALPPLAVALGAVGYGIAKDCRTVGLVELANARGGGAGLVEMTGSTPVLEEFPSSGVQIGKIYLANEAAFDSSHYSQPLTEYTVGWRQTADVEMELNTLAPGVPVPRKFEFKKAKNNEAFLSEDDDVRNPGADFKRVEHKGETVNAKTANKGLMLVLDKDEIGGVLEEEYETVNLIDRVMRNDLRRAGVIITGLGSANAKTWDTSAGKDPDGDTLDIVDSARDDSGVKPNTLIYGSSAWTKRIKSHRAQDTAGGYASASMTPQQVADWLGLKKGFVSEALYVEKKNATSKSKVVGPKVVVCYLNPGAGRNDPSNCKRFYSLCDNGQEYMVYRWEMGKFIHIIVEHYSYIAAPTTLGAKRIDVS